ncbi:DUF5960 family protein, partial [Streptococcus suis]|uniref:DUF5960 family protein n=1 Tax=Streptococcus suis TaxID=1307 RepID=UPI001EE75DDC
LMLAMAKSQKPYFKLNKENSKDNQDHYFMFNVEPNKDNKLVRMYRYKNERIKL